MAGKGEINPWDYLDPPTGICLHLGCGVCIQPGYINIDKYVPQAEVDWDLFHLPIKDETVNQIVAFDVLEHFGKFECPLLLKEWCRVLKPNRSLMMVVPDLVETCKLILNDPEDEQSLAALYGLQTTSGQFHKNGFTIKRLNQELIRAGFNAMYYGSYVSYDKCGRILVETYK